MAQGLLRNQPEAIKHFINDKKNGSAWRRILFEAPAYAMERIAISMWHSVYGPSLSQEEKEQYRALREEIESSLEKDDLDYLIKVMPEKQKEHYRSLLSLLDQNSSENNVQQPQKEEAVAKTTQVEQ